MVVYLEDDGGGDSGDEGGLWVTRGTVVVVKGRLGVTKRSVVVLVDRDRTWWWWERVFREERGNGGFEKKMKKDTELKIRKNN